jgi:hypothetical protein
MKMKKRKKKSERISKRMEMSMKIKQWNGH